MLYYNECSLEIQISGLHIFVIRVQGWQQQGTGGPCSHTQKGNKGKKKVSKQKLLKDCHQCQNDIVLAILAIIASRIQTFFLPSNHGGWKYFPMFHDPSTLKSILLTLC